MLTQRSTDLPAITASATSTKPSPPGPLDPGRGYRDLGQVAPHGAYSNRMPEELEHGSIVGGISAIQDRIPVETDVDAINIGHHPACHGELVVRANPAKNPEIVDCRGQPGIAQRRN